MATALRAFDPRVLLAAVLLGVSLSGCETVEGWFGKSKAPLPGERVAVFAERGELEADKDMASVPVVLPPPVVNSSWPQSGGFANYAMHNLEVGPSPQIIWTADVGAGTTSSRILTTPPVVAEGKVFAKDAQNTVSAFNADTGQMIWRGTLKPQKTRDTNQLRRGLSYYGRPSFLAHGFAAVLPPHPQGRREILNAAPQRPGARRAAVVRRSGVRHQHRQPPAGTGRGGWFGPLAVFGVA